MLGIGFFTAEAGRFEHVGGRAGVDGVADALLGEVLALGDRLAGIWVGEPKRRGGNLIQCLVQIAGGDALPVGDRPVDTVHGEVEGYLSCGIVMGRGVVGVALVVR